MLEQLAHPKVATGFRLAAVSYAAAEGGAADELLTRIATLLEGRGFRITGAVQLNSEGESRNRCTMALRDLACGRRTIISEYRGQHARGCRLDPRALEEVVGRVLATLGRDTDILIVNRFGKQEAQGRGFRSAFEAALAHNVPVLTAVNEENRHAWDVFTAGLGTTLPLDYGSVANWLALIGCDAEANRCLHCD